MSSPTARILHFSGAIAVAPLLNAKRAWSARAGLVLQLIDAEGRIGQGEASPLPGYSPDDVASCSVALEASCSTDLAAALAYERPDAIFSWVERQIPGTLPGARFALETALLDLLAQRRGVSLPHLFRPDPPECIPLAALLTGAPADETLATATDLFARGVRHFKIKLGFPGRWADELRLLAELRERLGAAVQLRFDANQAFAARDLEQRLCALCDLDPEYVEEPCASEDLFSLEAPPVPIALDETLRNEELRAPIEAWLRRHPGSTLILKPMVLGGFSACLHWADVARREGLRVVVSHAFDGPVALQASAALALALDCEQGAAGLMPHAGLSAWPRLSLAGIDSNAIHPTMQIGLGVMPLSPQVEAQ